MVTEGPLFSVSVPLSKTAVICFPLVSHPSKLSSKGVCDKPVPFPDNVKIQDNFARIPDSLNMSTSNGYPGFPLKH